MAHNPFKTFTAASAAIAAALTGAEAATDPVIDVIVGPGAISEEMLVVSIDTTNDVIEPLWESDAPAETLDATDDDVLFARNWCEGGSTICAGSRDDVIRGTSRRQTRTDRMPTTVRLPQVNRPSGGVRIQPSLPRPGQGGNRPFRR